MEFHQSPKILLLFADKMDIAADLYKSFFPTFFEKKSMGCCTNAAALIFVNLF